VTSFPKHLTISEVLSTYARIETQLYIDLQKKTGTTFSQAGKCNVFEIKALSSSGIDSVDILLDETPR
jgi:hypothetical protein